MECYQCANVTFLATFTFDVETEGVVERANIHQGFHFCISYSLYRLLFMTGCVCLVNLCSYLLSRHQVLRFFLGSADIIFRTKMAADIAK